MLIAYKRVEGNGEKTISFLESWTPKGFTLQSSGLDDFVLKLNDGSEELKKAVNDGSVNGVIDYLNKEGFFPREASKQEFNQVYEMCPYKGRQTLKQLMLDLSVLPSIETIVNESKAQYKSYISKYQ